MKCFAPQTSTPGPSQGQAPVRPDPYHGMANHRGTQAIGLHTSQQTQCTASAYHSLAWAQDSQMDYVHSSSSAGSVCMTCRGAVCMTCRGGSLHDMQGGSLHDMQGCSLQDCALRVTQDAGDSWWMVAHAEGFSVQGTRPGAPAGGWRLGPGHSQTIRSAGCHMHHPLHLPLLACWGLAAMQLDGPCLGAGGSAVPAAPTHH